MQEIDGLTAFGQTLRNGARRFPDRKDRRHAGQMLLPEVHPGFTLTPGDTVFTIGSCFARNVEDALVARGLNVPTAGFAAPVAEAPGRPNRILNQYNPGTMLQCLRDIDGGETGAGLYPHGGQVIDCLLATGSRPVAQDRALERRAQIRRLYAEGLVAASTVVVTLGLIESWYDRIAGLYLNEAPTRKILNAEPERFSFRQIEIDECREMVLELLDRLVDDSTRRVLLTVSPVPLQVTFAGGDATLRNAYSKATLRVVAEEAARHFPEVDYFPSYEMVGSLGLSAFGEDNVHVRPAVVDRVIGHMTGLYLRDDLPGPPITGPAEELRARAF
ncbi:MAG: GSCFA domain-containing protein [Rhodobacteraceae bacterium]|nr:GSCFA domain-containing protein [Paracoccaceae bacterium]MBR9819771.1 GSCFA domain-containing protein [Paracoccaceae bacterium]